MKSVLLSIQPKWCELITSGKKTVEIRKTKPKLKPPFKCYIYETQALYKPYGSRHLYEGRGRVIGEFICDEIKFHDVKDCINGLDGSCLTEKELYNYMNYPPVNPHQDILSAIKRYVFYRWHISDLVIYAVPKYLSEFRYPCKKYFEQDNPLCGDCEYYISRYEYPAECACDGMKPIKRPPQSWCYVERLDERR